MNDLIESASWHASPRPEFPYNCLERLSLPSLGTFYDGLRMPAILLTALYRVDPHTGRLAHNVKLIVQPDGPSNCDLNCTFNFKDYPPKQNIYKFEVAMDAVFEAATVLSRTGKIGANVGADGKIIKGGIEGSYEMGKQYAATKYFVHAAIAGRLDLRDPHHKLHATSYVVGHSVNNAKGR